LNVLVLVQIAVKNLRPFEALLTGEPMRYFADWKIDAFSVFVPILLAMRVVLRLTGAKIAEDRGYFQNVKHFFARPSQKF
jgi:hypothetical protein